MARVTLGDIARTLGLSTTTVSRALAGYPEVAESTRERVRLAVEELGYVPHRQARQLRRQCADAIGFVLSTAETRCTDLFFSEFLAGVGHELTDNDVDLLVAACPPGEREQRVYQRLVAGRRVDGFLLVCARRNDWRIRYLCQENVPIVASGHAEIPSRIPHLGVDGKAGMAKLVTHLVGQGHRRIGVIGAPPGLMLHTDRMEGYTAGLAQYGLPRDDRLIVSADLTRAGGYQAAQTLMDLDDPPTAIIGINDLTSLGALRAAQERGLVVGESIAIAAFDGTDAARHASTPLTTLHQPIYDVGRQASQMLLTLMRGESIGPPWPLLAPQLIVRASTTGQRR